MKIEEFDEKVLAGEDTGEYRDMLIFSDVEFVMPHIKSLEAFDRYLSIVLRTNTIEFEKIFFWIAPARRVDQMEVLFRYGGFENLTDHSWMMNSPFQVYLRSLIKDGVVDVLLFFLQKGLDVNKRLDLFVSTMLDQACSLNKVDLVTLFLQHGANVNHTASYLGKTAAFHAVTCGNVRVLDHLIMAGANLRHRTMQGRTLWHYVSYGSEKSAPAFYQRLSDMRIPCDEDAVETYLKSISRMTPDKIRIVKMMLEAGSVMPSSKFLQTVDPGSILTETSLAECSLAESQEE